MEILYFFTWVYILQLLEGSLFQNNLLLDHFSFVNEDPFRRESIHIYAQSKVENRNNIDYFSGEPHVGVKYFPLISLFVFPPLLHVVFRVYTLGQISLVIAFFTPLINVPLLTFTTGSERARGSCYLFTAPATAKPKIKNLGTSKFSDLEYPFMRFLLNNNNILLFFPRSVWYKTIMETLPTIKFPFLNIFDTIEKLKIQASTSCSDDQKFAIATQNLSNFNFSVLFIENKMNFNIDKKANYKKFLYDDGHLLSRKEKPKKLKFNKTLVGYWLVQHWGQLRRLEVYVQSIFLIWYLLAFVSVQGFLPKTVVGALPTSISCLGPMCSEHLFKHRFEENLYVTTFMEDLQTRIPRSIPLIFILFNDKRFKEQYYLDLPFMDWILASFFVTLNRIYQFSLPVFKIYYYGSQKFFLFTSEFSRSFIIFHSHYFSRNEFHLFTHQKCRPLIENLLEDPREKRFFEENRPRLRKIAYYLYSRCFEEMSWSRVYLNLRILRRRSQSMSLSFSFQHSWKIRLFLAREDANYPFYNFISTIECIKYQVFQSQFLNQRQNEPYYIFSFFVYILGTSEEFFYFHLTKLRKDLKKYHRFDNFFKKNNIRSSYSRAFDSINANFRNLNRVTGLEYPRPGENGNQPLKSSHQKVPMVTNTLFQVRGLYMKNKTSLAFSTNRIFYRIYGKVILKGRPLSRFLFKYLFKSQPFLRSLRRSFLKCKHEIFEILKTSEEYQNRPVDSPILENDILGLVPELKWLKGNTVFLPSFVRKVKTRKNQNKQVTAVSRALRRVTNVEPRIVSIVNSGKAFLKVCTNSLRLLEWYFILPLIFYFIIMSFGRSISLFESLRCSFHLQTYIRCLWYSPIVERIDEVVISCLDGRYNYHYLDATRAKLKYHDKRVHEWGGYYKEKILGRWQYHHPLLYSLERWVRKETLNHYNWTFQRRWEVNVFSNMEPYLMSYEFHVFETNFIYKPTLTEVLDTFYVQDFFLQKISIGIKMCVFIKWFPSESWNEEGYGTSAWRFDKDIFDFNLLAIKGELPIHLSFLDTYIPKHYFRVPTVETYRCIWR